jgi:hypothetical protein
MCNIIIHEHNNVIILWASFLQYMVYVALISMIVVVFVTSWSYKAWPIELTSSIMIFSSHATFLVTTITTNNNTNKVGTKTPYKSIHCSFFRSHPLYANSPCHYSQFNPMKTTRKLKEVQGSHNHMGIWISER